jgi:metal-responsive CopG/Arc/MetJ family transcriptional regulator
MHMGNASAPKKRRPGRPATGRQPPVTLRLPQALIDAIDAWSKRNKAGSRSDAIRRMIEAAIEPKSRKPRPRKMLGALAA